MHINVKNIILAKLIAQYFNLIISETRKNVVKSFPFLLKSLHSTVASIVRKATTTTSLAVPSTTTRTVDDDDGIVVAVLKLLLFIRIAFPVSSAKRTNIWSRNYPIYFLFSWLADDNEVAHTTQMLAHPSTQQLFWTNKLMRKCIFIMVCGTPRALLDEHL